ncbi:hypothetical protein E3N88_18083 [Mikania micrantha]|uniref:Uncharacterized protein n=1 Tax=Mikania micrantha TaxID=192012 RepID=A0A5N6NWS2_9ASTR|nr:hypothetical protein E3N88_18083 [Mikania micrantha]
MPPRRQTPSVPPLSLAPHSSTPSPNDSPPPPPPPPPPPLITQPSSSYTTPTLDPATIALSAVRLSGKLTDLMVASGTLKKEADTGKNKAESSKKPHHHQKKKQKLIKNYTVATPLNQVAVAQQNVPKKQYTGPHPLCTKCQYHHAASNQCRQCTSCGRKGHWVQQR